MTYSLPPVIVGEKIIPRNFGRIGHLFGSRMTDAKDELVSKEDQEKFTKKKIHPTDRIIITEKLDGMNAGVVKKDGKLYPINRKGYDSRSMGIMYSGLKPLGDGWANWVLDNYDIYNDILKEGERLVFENCIMTHTLRYKFTSQPVFLLAKYSGDNKRIDYNSLCLLAREYKLTMPPLLNIGNAIDPKEIIRQYPNGLSGSRDGIEGIVYYYECNGRHVQCVKFVSNPLIGTKHEAPTEYNESVIENRNSQCLIYIL